VSVWKDIAQRGCKVNITTLAVVSFLFLVPTAVILYIASHRVTIEEAEIEDNKNKNKIVITPQQVFSRDPWSVACARLDKRDDDEKNTKNKTNKSISKSTFDDDPPLYKDPRLYRPDGMPYINFEMFGLPSILVNDNNFHHHDDDW